MCIKTTKGDEVVQQINEHKNAHHQQDAVSGFAFRRWLAGEAGAVEMLGSLAVSVKESHHVEAGPHHEGQKDDVSYYDKTQEQPWIGVLRRSHFTVSMRISIIKISVIDFCCHSLHDLRIYEQVDEPR